MPNVEETQIFFNAFTGEVRKIFNEDKDKYLVLSWIIFNTNYSDEYKELKRNQCYFSFSMVESSCNIKRKKLQRIMKELENEGFIEWIFRSNSKGKESILGLKKGYGSEYGSGYGSGYGSDSINASVEVSKDTVQNTVQDTVQDTLSKKQSKKQNNIYSEVINEVVEYLNLKANKKLRANTKETVKLISARLEDNYTLDDFKKVIDIKTAEWINTDFKRYLQPSTLFGSKFDEYLNQDTGEEQKQQFDDDEQYIE